MTLHFLSMITEELDSTSSVSMVSDANDSVKPCYSEEVIQALMSKDGKTVLKAISQ